MQDVSQPTSLHRSHRRRASSLQPQSPVTPAASVLLRRDQPRLLRRRGGPVPGHRRGRPAVRGQHDPLQRAERRPGHGVLDHAGQPAEPGLRRVDAPHHWHRHGARQHTNNAVNSSVLVKDIATTIDGGPDPQTAQVQKSIMSCAEHGGQLVVQLDTTNAEYRANSYKSTGNQPSDILIKVVKAA